MADAALHFALPAVAAADHFPPVLALMAIGQEQI